MKTALIYILIYYASAVGLLAVSYFTINVPGDDMAYSLIWYYAYNIVIGAIVFPLMFWLIHKIKIGAGPKLLLLALLLLLLLNVVPFFQDRIIITRDLVRGIVGSHSELLTFYTISIHGISFFCMLVAFYIIRRPFLANLDEKFKQEIVPDY